jgi:hypothetical protein
VDAQNGDVLDIVAVDRDKPADPLRPQRRDDAGRPTAPIVAGEDRTLEVERVDQVAEIVTECGLLTRAASPDYETGLARSRTGRGR